jgi:hypothetical protein
MIDISVFSPHLFWDIDKDNIDIEQYPKFLVERVLQYGAWRDWLALKQIIGIKKISEEVVKIKSLDDKTLSFVSIVTGIPKKQFLCYIQKPFQEKNWIDQRNENPSRVG